MVVKQRVPIYQVIMDDIQRQIAAGQFDYDNPICTEKSICDKYGTSRITAKHAINKLEELGLLYRKRGVGSFVVRPSLKSVPTQVFAFVTPFSPTQGGVFRAVESASRIFTRKGHQLTIHISQTDTKRNVELLESLFNQNICGIVYYPLSASLPVETLNAFVRDGRPVIILDKETSHPGFSNIICDNVRGGYLLAEHLVSYGHTKTCYLSRFSPGELSSVSGRYRGYASCLEAAGIEPRFMQWESDSPTGYFMLQHLVNTLRLDGVSAILCENDEVAFNVHMCCLSLGIRVPEDMNITGFDNIEWATTGSAQITTVDQNFDIIGETIANTLLEEPYTPRNHTTPVQLVPRTSTNAFAKPIKPPSLSLQYALAAN